MVSPECAENRYMFTENIRDAVKKSGLIVRDISVAAGVKKSTLDDWLNARTKMAKADDLYKVCKVVGITVEEAVDGEDGKRYVRNWVASEGRGYSPPPRIADIVNGLLALDDKSLNIVRGSIQGTIKGILEGEKDGEREVSGT
jgi:transcriptional regulator with XRE-family HTH domain